jgi:DNA mismatch repair protein MSH2
LSCTPVVAAAVAGFNVENDCAIIIVGVAVADLARRVLSACQFVDDVQLCSLERVRVQVGAKECVVPKDVAEAEARRLADVLERCGMLVTARPKATFTARSLEQDLPKLLKPAGDGVEGTAALERHRNMLDRTQAAQALGGALLLCSCGWTHILCAAMFQCGQCNSMLQILFAGLIHYTELWQQPDEHGKYMLELYNPNRFMRLDAAALRALHVFGEGTGGASASFSLCALLSKAKTAMGKRLVKVGDGGFVDVFHSKPL